MVHSESVSGPSKERELPAVSRAERELLLTEILRGVSRAFYLTLRVLPASLREPFGLAYLLARAADTIADARTAVPDERLKWLLKFRAQVDGPASAEALKALLLSMASVRCTRAERLLLDWLTQAFAALESLPQPDRSQVRSVLVTLTRGMEMDLTTFPGEDSGTVVALKNAAELDRYVYYVAGCVGEFWTAITMSHTPALRGWDVERMSGFGVRFGKALQMTNVLRDVPRDLRLGRCYLPEDHLARHGVAPQELLDPSTAPRARPVLVEGIALALEHFQAAESYLLAIPRRCQRLRLAVLWPMLIGLGTLERLADNEGWLDPSRPSKVSRRWVYRMMALSGPTVPSNHLLRAWIHSLRGRVQRAEQGVSAAHGSTGGS